MHLGSAVSPKRIHMTTEYHVIAMRQEVRQITRTLGLGLAEQAKIATAMSTIARVLLVRNRSAVFTLQTIDQEAQAMLEIACALGPVPVDGTQPEPLLNLANIRLLVDEVLLSADAGEAILRVRMRLTRLARR
jgi:hypothetical protein